MDNKTIAIIVLMLIVSLLLKTMRNQAIVERNRNSEAPSIVVNL